VIAVTPVLRVSVEALRALLAVFALGVVQTEASPGDLVADSGGEVLVSVAETRLAADRAVAGVAECSDDADVALLAGGVVLALVASADAVAARRVPVAAAVDATIWSCKQKCFY